MRVAPAWARIKAPPSLGNTPMTLDLTDDDAVQQALEENRLHTIALCLKDHPRFFFPVPPEEWKRVREAL